ncbi:MAG: pyrroline-5-carboxylate reductase [Rhodospirillales bacterium]
MDTKLLLAGCGKMGGALLAGWLDQGLRPSSITVIEPSPDIGRSLTAGKGVAVVAAPGDLADDYRPDIVVFAIKPQIMPDAVPAYARFAESGAVGLSIAAGKTIAFFESALGKDTAVVRAMPNTPAAIRRGITVACANPAATPAQRDLCQSLLQAVGEVAWIDDENLMDAVTAVSGSGPAYVFLLAEYLAEAGAAAGLPAALSDRLARATVSGAGELLNQTADSAATLRTNVTSPGGTTAAALDVLMADDGLGPLLTKAVAAAVKRSKELAD